MLLSFHHSAFYSGNHFTVHCLLFSERSFSLYFTHTHAHKHNQTSIFKMISLFFQHRSSDNNIWIIWWFIEKFLVKVVFAFGNFFRCLINNYSKNSKPFEFIKHSLWFCIKIVNRIFHVIIHTLTYNVFGCSVVDCRCTFRWSKMKVEKKQSQKSLWYKILSQSFSSL